MPIYEYQCAKCHHHLEALQKLSDKPLRECPECGKHTLKRLMSAPMFRLAGSGWYETDFKSENERKRNLAGKDEAVPAEAASTDKAAKTDAPAEKKPESKPEPVTAKRSAAVKQPAAKSVTRAGAKPAARAKSAAAKKPAKKAASKR